MDFSLRFKFTVIIVVISFATIDFVIIIKDFKYYFNYQTIE